MKYNILLVSPEETPSEKTFAIVEQFSGASTNIKIAFDYALDIRRTIHMVNKSFAGEKVDAICILLNLNSIYYTELLLYLEIFKPFQQRLYAFVVTEG